VVAISGDWWLLVAISDYWCLLVAISGYWWLLVAVRRGEIERSVVWLRLFGLFLCFVLLFVS
jgi:hypothetical protein